MLQGLVVVHLQQIDSTILTPALLREVADLPVPALRAGVVIMHQSIGVFHNGLAVLGCRRVRHHIHNGSRETVQALAALHVAFKLIQERTVFARRQKLPRVILVGILGRKDAATTAAKNLKSVRLQPLRLGTAGKDDK